MKERIVHFEEDGNKYKLVVEYGFREIGDQEPYFSITAQRYNKTQENNRYVLESCGCLHDEIEEHVIELSHLLKWHMCFRESGPMHYEANGMYWWEMSKEKQPVYVGEECGSKALENFKKTVIYGVSKLDEIEFDLYITKEEMSNWLRERLPEVMEKFHKDMVEAELM